MKTYVFSGLMQVSSGSSTNWTASDVQAWFQTQRPKIASQAVSFQGRDLLSILSMSETELDEIPNGELVQTTLLAAREKAKAAAEKAELEAKAAAEKAELESKAAAEKAELESKAATAEAKAAAEKAKAATAEAKAAAEKAMRESTYAICPFNSTT